MEVFKCDWGRMDEQAKNHATYQQYTIRKSRNQIPTSKNELDMGRKWKILVLEASQPKMLAPR